MAARARLWAPITALLLSGCVTNAMNLIQFAGAYDAVIPSPAALQSEFKGRAFEVGTVSVDYWPRIGTGSLTLPDAAYMRLLDDQVRKAFAAAGLKEGNAPAYKVNAVIEVAKFTSGGAVVPAPSVFQVTMQVERPDGSRAMRGRFMARGNVVSVPVSTNGAILFLAIPLAGPAVAELGRAAPAMADTMARVALGLRNGSPLEAIEISAQDDLSVIQPAAVLRESKLGLRPLSEAEIRSIIGSELR